jgi:predicted Zn finger-like uncharacterized protein
MVISVQCPMCSTSFPVDTAKVPEEGVYARCSVCSGVFFVERPTVAVAGVPTARYAPLAPEAPTPEPWTASPEPWAPSAPESFEISAEATEAAPAAAPFEERPWGAVEPEPVREELQLDPVDTEPLQTPAAEPPGSSFEAHAPPPPPAETGTRAPAPAFTFGRRDPHDKARRLARVLVSDMIMYNPERHTRAMASGSLREDFDDEIKKSWEEYVEQVGEEIAKGTSYFHDALNEILAQGQRVFP